MGFWKHVKAQFLDVIEWMEDDLNTLGVAFSRLQSGHSRWWAIGRPRRSGGLFSIGRPTERYIWPRYARDPTRTPAIWGSFSEHQIWFNYLPYKGDIFFVSTRRFYDNKWGTPGPIMMEDPQMGAVEIRAFGPTAIES